MKPFSLYWLIAVLAGAVMVLWLCREADAHDIYTSWRQPGTGMSCCSEKDCRPLEDNEAKFENGHWVVWHKETGAWLSVPANVVINEPNPNGRAHLCASAIGTIWCFLKPDGGV